RGRRSGRRDAPRAPQAREARALRRRARRREHGGRPRKGLPGRARRAPGLRRRRGAAADARARGAAGPGGRGRPPDRTRAGEPGACTAVVAQGVAGSELVDTVRAAGGIVVRDGKLLLVHRDRYDDWTFPKGKAEPDEACALREVEEETGFRCRLDIELGETHYRDSKGRTKRVRWWLMTPLDGT